MLERLSTRERIFVEAVRLFSERGYHETTVGDIEAAAGLTPRAGGFYRHFPSKEDVLALAVRRLADEMIGEIRADEIAKLKSARAELLVIARALIRHAETYRALRLLVQREGHKLAALRKVARTSNERLASIDLIPWLENALKRSGKPTRGARELALTIFGAISAHISFLDRGACAFGAEPEAFLEAWASHWAAWLGERD
jgi:AcrR family transcriptional regulator